MLMPSPPPVHATAVNSKASWRASPAYVTSWGYVIPVCVARLKLILTRGHILACDTHWYAPRTRDLKTCPQDSIHASIQLEFNFIDNHLWFNQSNLKYFQCQLVLRIWKKGQVQLYKCHQDKTKLAHKYLIFIKFHTKIWVIYIDWFRPWVPQNLVLYFLGWKDQYIQAYMPLLPKCECSFSSSRLAGLAINVLDLSYCLFINKPWLMRVHFTDITSWCDLARKQKESMTKHMIGSRPRFTLEAVVQYPALLLWEKLICLNAHGTAGKMKEWGSRWWWWCTATMHRESRWWCKWCSFFTTWPQLQRLWSQSWCY